MSPRALPVQMDLFDVPVAAPSAVVIKAPADCVHWLVVTVKLSRTACGIVISSYRYKECAADIAVGAPIRCTHDYYDGTVTCPRCKEVIR